MARIMIRQKFFYHKLEECWKVDFEETGRLRFES